MSVVTVFVAGCRIQDPTVHPVRQGFWKNCNWKSAEISPAGAASKGTWHQKLVPVQIFFLFGLWCPFCSPSEYSSTHFHLQLKFYLILFVILRFDYENLNTALPGKHHTNKHLNYMLKYIIASTNILIASYTHIYFFHFMIVTYYVLATSYIYQKIYLYFIF